MSLINSTTRRIFLLQVAATGTAAFAVTPAVTPATKPATGSTPAKVDEKDATAVALGYVSENTRADKKKYPKFSAEQKCSTCVLYQGKAGDASGPCPIFAGKLVAANGWCSSYVKKAA